jgi:hypothetical protein
MVAPRQHREDQTGTRGGILSPCDHRPGINLIYEGPAATVQIHRVLACTLKGQSSGQRAPLIVVNAVRAPRGEGGTI